MLLHFHGKIMSCKVNCPLLFDKARTYVVLYFKIIFNWNVQLFSLRVPDPVLFATIEAGSVSQEKLLVSALRDIAREDPSLRVEFNDEAATGDGFHENRDQIVIAGMGELHFDIVMDRLRKEYKVDADMGSLSVAYKETVVGKSSMPSI